MSYGELREFGATLNRTGADRLSILRDDALLTPARRFLSGRQLRSGAGHRLWV
jgi:hypothetical protein